MTHQEKVNYMLTATRICGYDFKLPTIDLVVSLYDLITVEQGEASLRTIAKVMEEVNHRNNPQPILA